MSSDEDEDQLTGTQASEGMRAFVVGDDEVEESAASPTPDSVGVTPDRDGASASLNRQSHVRGRSRRAILDAAINDTPSQPTFRDRRYNH